MRIIAAVALTFGLCTAAHAADCSALQIKNSVKMEPLSRYNLMVVPITLNGVEKKFLFDSGGGLNVVNNATVKELGLPEYHSTYHMSDLYGEDSDYFVQVHEVIFGAAKTTGVQFQIIGNMGFTNGPAPFDGSLSVGPFTHDDIDLDFGAERLNFFSTDHCPGRVVYWPHQVLSVIPVTLEQGQIDIPVTLDGHPLTAMIDTGSSITTLNIDRAERKMGFSPADPLPHGRRKDDPDEQIYHRRFSALSLDGVTVQNPVITVRPLQSGQSQGASGTTGTVTANMDERANRLGPDMLIGMDVLRRLHIYIAVDEEKLYVTEATPGESVLFKGAAGAQK